MEVPRIAGLHTDPHADGPHLPTVMIRALLDHRGEADDEQIAKNLLSHDRSQIEYYQHITRNMVGRVLAGHDVIEKEERNIG